MSGAPLVDVMKVPCTLYNRIETPDGMGGFDHYWSEAGVFDAVVKKDNSLRARIAEKEGVTEVYTVTTDENIVLRFHNAFKRNEDGAVFRVTSNAIDSSPPKVATFHFNQVTAERWELD